MELLGGSLVSRGPQHQGSCTRREMLIRVVAPHFVAGLVIVDGVVSEAAPILAWSRGLQEDALRAYLRRKGWLASILPRHGQ